MPDERHLLKATGITVAIDGRAVLAEIELAVAENEIVSIIGPNGAGKTTLLRVALGLLEPDAGDVWRRPGIRIGYVPQRLTIDPVLPLTVRRFLALGRVAAEGEYREVLAEVGIEHLLARPVQQVSGGEFQRLLLARALLRNPHLLVLDEPVQGVDVTGQAEIYGLIARIRDRRGCGVLLVSHDLHLVMAATDRVLCINHHLCCAGHPEAVSRHPEYVALFGPRVAEGLAPYTHRHDHEHGPDGEVRPAAHDHHHGHGHGHGHPHHDRHGPRAEPAVAPKGHRHG